MYKGSFVSLLILVVLWVRAASLPAQSNPDSLWQAWQNTALHDTMRLKALQSLTWGMLNKNPDSAYALSQQELDFSRQRGYKLWEAKGLYNIATYYYNKSEYAQAMDFYQKSLELRIETGDLKGEGAIYGNFGVIYNQQGNNLKALEYQLKSMAINDKIRDTLGLCANYSNIAIIYQQQDNQEKALEYYEKALHLYEHLNKKGSISLIYNNIGNLYSSNEEPDRALEYFYKSLEIRTELGDRVGLAITTFNIGSAYVKKGDFRHANSYVTQAIDMFRQLGDQSGLSHAYYLLGDIANKQDHPQGAVRWCTESLQLSRELGIVSMQRNACHCLYKANKSMGKYAEALTFHEQYKLFTDSLKQGEIELQLNQLDFEKDLLTDSLAREEERRELEVAYQTELNKKTRNTNILLGVGLGVLVLALFFLSGMLYFRKNSAQLTLRTEILEKQPLLNEIALLKTQVNPHFLFNSLSILSSLVQVNPELSEQFIDQLSRSYRYILEQKDQSLVSLRTELEFIRSYAFLLKIRFEKKFDLQIQLPEALLDSSKIAPLTLQLLIENAVKHNRMSQREPLVVEVLVAGNTLIVKNRLQPRSTPDTSTGIGLQNIVNRYALLSDRPVVTGPQGEDFIVRIPLL
ncbi:MAG: tetratricopeptide repeat protein [Saprospiraceae bacterium]|nr:tetratricopeptide repeat protein [Saprospiraceae bacterium]